MDRLSTLAIALALPLALGSCDSKKEEPQSRVNTTKVAQKTVDTAAFCDVQFPGTTGPKLTVPKLVGGELPPAAGTWQWINVWATWCKPCVEEMPRLAQWREKLGAAGKPYELSFVSVDEDEADLVAFKKDHPSTPASPRLAEPAKQADWYVSVGLDGGAPVPIHIFVEPTGHVRCARAGGVREQDYAAIEKLLSQ
jgi:thiol-disulfide isomerase/thioredoxin